MAAALLAALVCVPLPLLNEPAFAEDAAPAADAPAVQQAPGARAEIVSERTESTTTWANGDGTTTVEAYTGPIRVKQPDGSWKPVDTTLVAENGVVRPKTAAADMTFSGGGSGEPLAEVSRGGRTLGLDWPGKLPEPRLDGPTAVYPDAVDGGDLVVTALKEGFSHSVVLHQRPDAPVSYRLPISADGLTLHETTDERLRWSDSSGHTVATAPMPVMWGSGEKHASGEPEDLEAVDVTIERDDDTGDQVLVLKPDAEFLADPALEYPVTIDPTDSLFGPVTDTWIQYDDYLTSQRGSTELKAGTYNGTEKARSYLKFDVAKYAGKHILDTDLAPVLVLLVHVQHGQLRQPGAPRHLQLGPLGHHLGRAAHNHHDRRRDFHRGQGLQLQLRCRPRLLGRRRDRPVLGRRTGQLRRADRGCRRDGPADLAPLLLGESDGRLSRRRL